MATTRDEPGFDWVDAGIGASATLGLVLLAGGAGLAVTDQRRRRRATPHWVRQAGTSVDSS